MRAVVALYAILIVVFAVYGFFWSDYSFKSAGWILLRSLLWPVVVIEYLYDLAKAIVKFVVGAIVLIGVLGFILSNRR